MVNREARDAYAAILSDFLAGCATNQDYIRTVLSLRSRMGTDRERDDAVESIWLTLWPLYDDVGCHLLKGNHELDDASRALMERCVLFLEGNSDYEWSEECSQQNLWPFSRVSDYYAALESAQPRADKPDEMGEAGGMAETERVPLVRIQNLWRRRHGLGVVVVAIGTASVALVYVLSPGILRDIVSLTLFLSLLCAVYLAKE